MDPGVKAGLFADPERRDAPPWRDVDCTTLSPSGTQRRYGYLRIFSFDVEDDQVDAFVHAIREAVEGAPDDGLVIDLRGNPGGHIIAGERLLQLFTPRRVQPQALQFINTPEALQLARGLYQGANELAFLPLEREATATAAPYVSSLPLGSMDAYNDVGQVYQGPVVLIVDSTSDVFAAGFQDHGVGPVIGTHRQTGGGGANVWTYEMLGKRVPEPYPKLPGGASFTVAVRRTTRVLGRDGLALEDLGVVVDQGDRHLLSRADVLSGNVDLLERAIRALDEHPRPYRLQVAYEHEQDGFALRTRELARVDVFIGDHRPLASVDDPDSKLVPLGDRPAPPERALFLGYAGGDGAGLDPPEPVVAVRWARR